MRDKQLNITLYVSVLFFSTFTDFLDDQKKLDPLKFFKSIYSEFFKILN